MKRILLSLVLVLSALSAMAERGTLVLRSPQEYQIIYISPNGKWAAGVYYDYSYNPFAFRWNLESDEIQMLSSLEISVPSGIANDGTVVGNYMATDISPNGAPVETPGYFTDRWHTLPMVGEFVPGVELFASMGGGIAGGISPDGRWMTGASYIEGKLHPMVWKDGQLYRDLFDGTDCVPYCISCDGSHIGGWKYITDDYGVRYSFVWNLAEESPRVLSRYGAPWCAAKQFTSDGKKVLMWNGWKNTLLNKAANMDVVYDVETQEMTNVRTISDNPANFDIFALADDGTILGYEADDGLNRAIIYKDGTPHFVTDYFKEQGIHDFFNDPYVFNDPEQFPYPVVQCGYAISADAKAMGFYHYEPTGYTQSSIVMTDQELTHRAPCGLKARGLRGEGTARVEWKAPLANAEAVQQYIVYRDGNAVAEVPATSRLYFDNNLADGTYAYSVAATYADGTTSPATATANAEVTTSCLQSPYAVFARQRGFQGAAIQWHAPRTNHITKGYFDDATDEIVGFGGGDNSFEVAIRIDREEMLQYKGQQIRAVQFYPMSAQLAWTLSIYEMAADGTLTTLHQQQVSETLALGQLNTIALDKTLNIGDLKNDIVVGVAPTVSSLTASYNVVGMVYGRCTSGVTDLLRLPIDPKFDSLYALAQQSATTNEVSWAIGLVIDNPKLGADADKVEKYNVFVDGALATTTAATSATLPQLAFGQRTVGVQAIYANGLQSTVETTQLSLSPDSELYGVQQVSIGVTEGQPEVSFSWQAPEDRDTHVITYSSRDQNKRYGVHGNSEENYALQAAARYQADKFRGCAGMQIKAVRFFPTCDATFTIIVTCNDQEVVYEELDDYVLNQWNTVELSEPVTIAEGLEYDLIIDCYDATPEEAPLGVDTQSPYVSISDLVSTDGSYFTSLTETGVFGNWMMDLVIESPETLPLHIDGYNVLVDGKQVNADKLIGTQTAYTFPAVDGEKHNVSVATCYQGVALPVDGKKFYFRVGDPDGIYGATVPADSKLAHFYDLSGRRLAMPIRGINVMNGKKVIR